MHTAIRQCQAPSYVLADYLALKEQQQEMQEAGDASIGSTSISTFLAASMISYKFRDRVERGVVRDFDFEAKRAAWLRRFKLRLKGSHLVFSFTYPTNGQKEEEPLLESRKQVIVPLDDEEKLYRLFEKGVKIDPDELDERLFDLNLLYLDKPHLVRRLCRRMELYVSDAQQRGKITHLVREPELYEGRNKTRKGQEAHQFEYHMPWKWCKHLFTPAREDDATIIGRVMGAEMLFVWKPPLSDEGVSPQSSVDFRDPGLHVKPRFTKDREELTPEVIYETLHLIMEG
jgi:hypothetical protein